MQSSGQSSASPLPILPQETQQSLPELRALLAANGLLLDQPLLQRAPLAHDPHIVDETVLQRGDRDLSPNSLQRCALQGDTVNSGPSSGVWCGDFTSFPGFLTTRRVLPSASAYTVPEPLLSPLGPRCSVPCPECSLAPISFGALA